MAKQYEKLFRTNRRGFIQTTACLFPFDRRRPRVAADPGATLGTDWFGAVHDLLTRPDAPPDGVAATDPSVSWTYAELNVRSNQLAHYLLERGAQRSLHIRPPSAPSYGLFSGFSKPGLDPAYPAARLIPVCAWSEATRTD